MTNVSADPLGTGRWSLGMRRTHSENDWSRGYMSERAINEPEHGGIEEGQEYV